MHASDLARQFDRVQEAEIRKIEASLGSGKASDWPHYRALVGEISGRRKAMADLREMVKKLETDDDGSV